MFYFVNQNVSKMYIIINKITQESSIIKEKTTLSTVIDRSTSTIRRNESKKYWQTDKFWIYNPQKVLIKSNRGGINNFKG
jgi:hypothetical protein